MKHMIFVILARILGVLAVIVFLANIRGKKIFFITDDRMSFITIGAIGLAMCGFGITRNLSGINWINPFQLYCIYSWGTSSFDRVYDPYRKGCSFY